MNKGGCGVFAYNLYRRLDTSRYCLKIIDKGVHVVIYDKEKHYFLDSNGIKDSLGVGLYFGKLIEDITPDSLLKMINDPNIWNPTYDRKQDSIIEVYVDRL